MAKKFKTAPAVETDAPGGLRLTLQDYIAGYAPEVLLPLPFMQGCPALRFWQQTFEPQRPGEAKQLGKDNIRWPYAERLVYLAREFIRLDDRCRRYVLKAAESKIWWRGDDIQRFRVIVAAQLSYRRLSEAEQAEYRRRLMLAARGFGR
ncbi:MAG: hypothetical protein PHW13_10310 [Methylococcales bacterium]|nr:hypothetical protein [Methylococcales bacterium]